MAGLNKVIIIGNLGNDPEMRYTGNGTPVVSFSVAVNDQWGENSETEWFNVIAWKKLAETCNEYLSKGQQVFVEGRQRTNKWEGEDGQTHYKTELIANKVVFLGQKRERQEDDEVDIDPDDLPF